jgi:hypothetical protein
VEHDSGIYDLDVTVHGPVSKGPGQGLGLRGYPGIVPLVCDVFLL